MTGTDCGLFTHKSVPVIFEPPCIRCGSHVVILHSTKLLPKHIYIFPTLKVYVSSMLSLLASRSKKENFGVVSSGIIFITSSVKIN